MYTWIWFSMVDGLTGQHAVSHVEQVLKHEPAPTRLQPMEALIAWELLPKLVIPMLVVALLSMEDGVPGHLVPLHAELGCKQERARIRLRPMGVLLALE